MPRLEDSEPPEPSTFTAAGEAAGIDSPVTRGRVLARTTGALSFVDTVHSPGRFVGWHAESTATLTLQVAGECEEDVGRFAFSVSPGTALFKPPGARHRDRVGPKGARALILEVPADLIHRVAREALQLAGPLSAAGALWAKGIGLYLAAARGDHGLRLRLEELLLSLGCSTGWDTRERSSAPWLRRVAEMIRSFSAEKPPSLVDLASAVGRHPVYVARAFRRGYGMSPGEYLHWCRVERAVPAVALQTRSLADIALELGFADQSHLGRTFRSAVGISPGRLRRFLATLQSPSSAAGQ